MCNNYSFSIATVVTQTHLNVMLYVHCMSCCSTFCTVYLDSVYDGGICEFLKAPCNFDCKRAFKWLTSHVHTEEMLGIISLDFDIEGQLLIIYSFVEYLKKKM
jgi:hypothetical protein